MTDDEKCCYRCSDGVCLYSRSPYHLMEVSGRKSDDERCSKCKHWTEDKPKMPWELDGDDRASRYPRKVMESPIPVGERRAMKSKSRTVWSSLKASDEPGVAFTGLKDPYDTRGFHVIVEVLERPIPLAEDWVWVKVVAAMRVGDAELEDVDDGEPILVRAKELKKVRRSDEERMKGWDWDGLFKCNVEASVRRMVYSNPAEFTVAVRTECKHQDQCKVEWAGEGHPPTGGCYCLRPYANIVAYFCAMPELIAAGKPPWGKVKPRYTD